jgi:hypothetical protein
MKSFDFLSSNFGATLPVNSLDVVRLPSPSYACESITDPGVLELLSQGVYLSIYLSSFLSLYLSIYFYIYLSI